MNDRKESEIATSIVAFFLVGAAGFTVYSLLIDRELMKLAPPESWPFLGKVLHFGSPVFSVILISDALFLLFSKSGTAHFFRLVLAQKNMNIVAMVALSIIGVLLAWSTTGLPLQLLRN